MQQPRFTRKDFKKNQEIKLVPISLHMQDKNYKQGVVVKTGYKYVTLLVESKEMLFDLQSGTELGNRYDGGGLKIAETNSELFEEVERNTLLKKIATHLRFQPRSVTTSQLKEIISILESPEEMK